MKRRRAAWALLAVVTVAGLAACASPTDEDTRSATAGMPDLEQDLVAQKWRLDAADSSPRPVVDSPVTLHFHADGSVSGQGPCNRYFGSYTTDLDDWTVTISKLGSTKKLCDDSVMRAETGYLRALTRVRDVEFSDGHHHVVLDNDAGDRLAYDAYDLP